MDETLVLIGTTFGTSYVIATTSYKFSVPDGLTFADIGLFLESLMAQPEILHFEDFTFLAPVRYIVVSSKPIISVEAVQNAVALALADSGGLTECCV